MFTPSHKAPHVRNYLLELFAIAPEPTACELAGKMFPTNKLSLYLDMFEARFTSGSVSANDMEPLILAVVEVHGLRLP